MERVFTGFTDKSDRPILDGDVVMFRNDYRGDETEPDEPHNDFGIVSWGGPKQGALVDCASFKTNREDGSFFLPHLIEEYGEVEIISSPGQPDYDQYVTPDSAALSGQQKPM